MKLGKTAWYVLGIGILVIAAIIREDRLIIPTGKDKMQVGDIIYFVPTEVEIWQKG